MFLFFTGFTWFHNSRYETVAGAVSMCFYFLATNPEAQEKAAAEAATLAAKTGGKLTGEDANDLKYIDNVLSESMRFAAVPTITR